MSNAKSASLALALALVACGSEGAGSPTSAGAAQESQAQQEAPLRAAIGRLAVAWNAGNGNAWAAEFWPDGSLVNILGVVFPNAAAVGAVTNKILAGPFAGSTFSSTVTRIRFIGNAAAIVDTDVSVTNFRALPPGAVATSPGLLLTRLTHVFENRSGVWKIEAAQNTAVLPMAMAPP